MPCPWCNGQSETYIATKSQNTIPTYTPYFKLRADSDTFNTNVMPLKLIMPNNGNKINNECITLMSIESCISLLMSNFM